MHGWEAPLHGDLGGSGPPASRAVAERPGHAQGSRARMTRQMSRLPAVAALGGGHGLSATLTAIVTVADDGGSSGRLREEFGCLPPGDLRMALAALCGDDLDGRLWADVLQ